jgi:hypothetical protein
MGRPVTAPHRLGGGPSPVPPTKRHRRLRLAPLAAIAVAALPTVLWTLVMWGRGEDDVPIGAPPSNVAPNAAPQTSMVIATPLPAAPVTAVPVTAAPVTAAPVTAAPATPAPVTPAPATPARVTAAPATAAPATAATTVVATSSPPDESQTASATTPPTGAFSSAAPLSPAQADSFFRGYYGAVAARDYETSWSQLAPEFQRGRARSFDYYVGFWDQNDIEVGEVELVAADDREATVHVDLSWNGSNTWQTDEFVLRRHDTSWLIAGQRTVSA